MKHAAPDHPKMYELAGRLQIPQYAAVGIMEMLWHYSVDYAPRGDIGRFPNSAIARAVDWRGNVDDLVAALVSCHWLEESDEHRLLIHDWPDHCEDLVHMKLARHGIDFANGRRPNFRRLSSKERAKIEVLYLHNDAETKTVRTKRAKRATSMRPALAYAYAYAKANTKTSPPSPPPLNGALPTHAAESPEEKPREKEIHSPEPPTEILSPKEVAIKTTAERIYLRHPAVRRCSIKEIRDLLRPILKRMRWPDDLKALHLIDTNHEAWCQTDQWQRDGGEFAKGLANWLAPTKDRYLHAPEVHSRDNLFSEPVAQETPRQRNIRIAEENFLASHEKIQ